MQDVWSCIRTVQLSNFRDLLGETLIRTAGDQQRCLQRSQLGFMCLPVGTWLTNSMPSLCAGAAPPVHVVVFMLLLLLEVQEQQEVPCPRLSHKMQLRTRQNRRAGTKGCTKGQLCVQNNCTLPLLQPRSIWALTWDGIPWDVGGQGQLMRSWMAFAAAWEWYWSHPKGGICCRPGDFLTRSAYSLH